MFFVCNELRTRKRCRFCTPCGHYCFNFPFFSFFLLLRNRARSVTVLDKSSSSITIFTLSPRKSGISLVIWATELDTSLSSSICQPASINKSSSGNRARYGFIEVDISTGLDEQINRPRYVDTELELSRTVKQTSAEQATFLS